MDKSWMAISHMRLWGSRSDDKKATWVLKDEPGQVSSEIFTIQAIHQPNFSWTKASTNKTVNRNICAIYLVSCWLVLLSLETQAVLRLEINTWCELQCKDQWISLVKHI